MRAMCLVVVLAACVQSGAVVCPDQRVCPETYTCSAFGCLSPEQFKACDGVADGETCQVQSGTGRCAEGACVVAICGNGVVEPSETCDDGNQFNNDGCNGTCSSDESCGNGLVEREEQCDCGAATASDQASCEGTVNGGGKCTLTCLVVRCGNGETDPGEVCDDGNGIGGDGCSYDCTSLEECGNGILDFFAGEQCDDGNLRGIDGCSPSCRVERAEWRGLEAATPAAVNGSAGAYDSARRVFVMFGGVAGITQHDVTWELDGTTWTRIPVVIHPLAREYGALAYDAKRRKIVLFGGFNASTLLDDTWEYDGTEWKQLQPATKPSARFAHRLAYDAARERVVLFGGQTTYGGTKVADTWEWDGTTWVEVTPPDAPPAVRAHYGLTYDPVRGRVVLFGGLTGSPTFAALGDTWEYDGTTWTERVISGPGARSGHTLEFDQARGKVVMTGGNETWTLDTTGWTQISTADPDRRYHASAYDTERRAVIIVGGSTVTSPQTTNALSELGATTWSTPSITPPSNQAGMGLAYDSRRGRTVMFTTAATPQTWEFSRVAWRLMAPATSPNPGRTGAGMAYDAKRGRIVVFGGSSTGTGAGTRLAETWEYDGVTWAQATPTASPPARTGCEMIYDSVRERIVIFGGFTTGAVNDMWEYDGTTWIEVQSTVKPPARYQHAMAYDPVRQRIVMLGGSLDGTWVFDATGWHQLATTGPTLEHSGAMVYDAGRDRIVLHGGFNEIALDETWELVDDTWTRLVPETSADVGPPRRQHRLVYDTSLRRVVLFGGAQATAPFTWVLAPTPIEPPEVCSTPIDLDGDTKLGCADDDCWGVCSPQCVPDAPAASCSMTPRCGDGTCTDIENCRICPSDCPVGEGRCTALCGDGYCDPGETSATCPGDCL